MPQSRSTAFPTHPKEKKEWNYENTPIKYIENFTPPPRPPPKNENFQIKKKSDIFQISAQNIYCGYSLEPPRRGGSNQYPQYMFLSKNKKNNVYPCKSGV